MSNVVRFHHFSVDLAAGRIYKRHARLRLAEQPFRVLALLLERPGEVVTRDDLRRRLWPGEVFVDFDNLLNTAVAKLRDALGDSPVRPRFIETLPKHGYRFIGSVSAGPDTGSQDSLRLMVLPLVNSNGDPAEEYFSDAMTDEIITALAAIAPRELGVIARTTAMRYKNSHKDVARIGRELNVDYVVEGGVRRTEDRLFVNVQLIQAAAQTHVFAHKYDAEMRDIFGLHKHIAQDITRHIPMIADALRADLRKAPTEDLAAYNEYIKGRSEMWKLTAEATAEARRHFELALARDPEYVLACHALGELYWYVGFFGYAPSSETDRIGRSYVLRAREIDDASAETHVLLSIYPTKQGQPSEIDYYDWAEIQNEITRARELDPNSRLVRVRHAMIEAVFGRLDEAIAELDRALESDPLSFDARCWLVSMLYLARQLDRARAETSVILDLEPQHFLPYYQLGHVCREMRKFDESAAAFRQATELSGELPLVLGFLGLSLGMGGHALEARAVLDRLTALARQRYVPPTCFAWAHLGLGDVDGTFLWMQRAVDGPDRMIEPIRIYPFLDPLRSDPRFTALLRKMKLA